MYGLSNSIGHSSPPAPIEIHPAACRLWHWHNFASIEDFVQLSASLAAGRPSWHVCKVECDIMMRASLLPSHVLELGSILRKVNPLLT